MIELLRTTLTGQFEASLSMLNDCIQKCPPEHWDGKIAKYAFWHVTYHTLCYADLYLSPGEKSFPFREIHPRGWSEFKDEYPSRRFEQRELSDYLAVCRRKAVETIAAETPESLSGESGFSWLPFSRAEAHLYNIRHVQHHAGQLSASLRKIGAEPRWVSTGWR